jgi:hypothetical protein
LGSHQFLYFSHPCNFLKIRHFKQIISQKISISKNNLIPTKHEKVLHYLKDMQMDIHIKFLETTTFAHEWPNDGPSEGLHEMCNLFCNFDVESPC